MTDPNHDITTLLSQLLETQRQRDRLVMDAIGALSRAGICTPEEGYAKAPHLLAGDIANLARERDEWRDNARRLQREVGRLTQERNDAVIQGADLWDALTDIQNVGARHNDEMVAVGYCVMRAKMALGPPQPTAAPAAAEVGDGSGG